MPVAVPPPPQRKGRPRPLAAETDRESIQVGIVLTLFIWPALMWLTSLGVAHLGREKPGQTFTPRPKPVFNIEINSDDFLIPRKEEPPPPPPDRFIETNPDAPENIPDETRNFSDRNQQVAQETEAKITGSDLPSSEGKKDHETNQIVDGTLSDPELATPPPPPPPASELMKALREEQLQRERNPLPGEAQNKGDSETGYGFNLGRIPDNVEDIPERIEGDKRAPLIVGAPQATVAEQRIDPQRPLPRPRLERRVRPAVLAERIEGTSNIGITGADARWSQYGEYLKRLVDSVQIEWERIIGTMKGYPPPGSTVKVRFRIEAGEGLISEIIEVDGNAGNQGTRACVSAITSRAPYGKWTEDMLAALGESQELTFTFLYY